MLLSEKLMQLRKKKGLSQQQVAEKLDVSRQTVSKWETGQTVPELNKARLLSELYNVTYDYLINENTVNVYATNVENIVDEIDWTKAWSEKYPILASYQGMAGVNPYSRRISQLYDDFKKEFGFDDTDTVLILKDILYQKYKTSKNKIK